MQTAYLNEYASTRKFFRKDDSDTLDEGDTLEKATLDIFIERIISEGIPQTAMLINYMSNKLYRSRVLNLLNSEIAQNYVQANMPEVLHKEIESNGLDEYVAISWKLDREYTVGSAKKEDFKNENVSKLPVLDFEIFHAGLLELKKQDDILFKEYIDKFYEK